MGGANEGRVNLTLRIPLLPNPSADGSLSDMGVKRRASPAEPKFERERLEELFHSLDVNKDGRIDTKELQKKLRELGIDDSEAAVSALRCWNGHCAGSTYYLRGLVRSM